mmetsp:Transcript_9446/g.18178  ORF Transcript_9446/g.18178 Transcript_9446/m.18178 type:complete len:300 (-) Transcript_9446:1470-2369(-)
MKGTSPVLRQVCSTDLLKASRPLHRVASEEYFRAAKLHSSSKRPSEVSSEMLASVEKELSRLVTNLHSPAGSVSPPLSVASLSPQSRLTFSEWKLKKDFEISLRRFAFDRVKQKQQEVRQSTEELKKSKEQRARENYESWLKRKTREGKLKKKNDNKQKRLELRLLQEKKAKARTHFIDWLKGSFKQLNEHKDVLKKQKDNERRRQRELERLAEERRKQADKCYKDWLKSKSAGLARVEPKKEKAVSRKKASMLAYSPNKKTPVKKLVRKSIEEISSISQKHSEPRSLDPSFYSHEVAC